MIAGPFLHRPLVADGDYAKIKVTVIRNTQGRYLMRTSAFTQIEPTPWPSGYGDAIAVTRVQPERLSRAFGLTFVEGDDNLDAYEAAAIRLRSGRMLGLVRHAGSQGSGTEVHADSADDLVSALREFLDAFDLSVEDLSWMRDEIPAEHLRLADARARA